MRLLSRQEIRCHQYFQERHDHRNGFTAFRLLKKQCEDQRGKDMARKVIVAVTDAKKGAARTTADKEGYKSFIIPDNVGGRFSVLTP